ncbi:MAG TPA: hypothetical protein VFQ53_09880 [Kofleriaceae bacterium]|nr:hypothetical protein [Kofleriaceae bacterium]
MTSEGDDRWQLVDGLLARLDDEQTRTMADALAKLRAIDPARLSRAQRTELAGAVDSLRAVIATELAETTRILAGHDAALADWIARAEAADGPLRDDARERCDEIIARHTADEAVRRELEAQRAILDELAARVAAVSSDTESTPK